MRIGVLMAIGSPWSTNTALRLAELGNHVHVIDFAAPVDESGSYIGVGDATYAANLDRVRSTCAGVHFLGATHPSLRYFLAAPRLAALLRSIDADVLLTLYAGGFAALAMASNFRPYTCYAVGTDVLGTQGTPKKWINRRALTSAAIVFANGEYLAKRTKTLAPQARVMPLLLGIDPTVFQPREHTGSRVEIVCTRGFMPVYNNDAILRALALIPAGAPDFRLTFTSGGPDLSAARSLAESLRPTLRERVRFLGGVRRELLIETLQTADVYVSVSRSDGTSTALLEALACGLFPVLSDIPQHHEWFAGDNAVSATLDDDQSLADALTIAISDKARRERARTINRQLVLDRADSRQTSERLNLELTKLVAARGRAA